MKTYRQPFRGEWPISQRYGELIEGVTYNNKPHTGIDYACPEGTPILASADGIVIKAGWDMSGYGNRVIILHEAHVATLYAHLRECAVYDNQKVKQGDVIGYSGSTGNCTGPHLHFEARERWNDWASHFDPMDLPLMSYSEIPQNMSADDSAQVGNMDKTDIRQVTGKLKDADAFQEGDTVRIVAPLGAKAFFRGFDDRTTFQQGSRFYYTGNTTQRNGYTYLEVVPLTTPVWIAVHDGDTQILDKQII